MSCHYPQCQFNADRGSEYCVHHRKHFGTPAVKVRKAIPKVSEKRKVINREYKAVVNGMREENDRCEIMSPVCTGFMQGGDHIQKRSPANLTKRENIQRACNACNLYKETHPEWAKKAGKSKSRFKN